MLFHDSMKASYVTTVEAHIGQSPPTNRTLLDKSITDLLLHLPEPLFRILLRLVRHIGILQRALIFISFSLLVVRQETLTL